MNTYEVRKYEYSIVRARGQIDKVRWIIWDKTADRVVLDDHPTKKGAERQMSTLISNDRQG